MYASESTKSSAKIFELRPLPRFASQGDLLRYVECTRRQLDRFELLPAANGKTLATDDAGRIRSMCDELEADILMGLST